jgi:hypothetical protein
VEAPPPVNTDHAPCQEKPRLPDLEAARPLLAIAPPAVLRSRVPSQIRPEGSPAFRALCPPAVTSTPEG